MDRLVRDGVIIVEDKCKIIRNDIQLIDEGGQNNI